MRIPNVPSIDTGKTQISGEDGSFGKVPEKL
jgi:hypothetical protein